MSWTSAFCYFRLGLIIKKMFQKLDQKYQNSPIWEFIKFNLVSSSTALLQLILANFLPLLTDYITQPLPSSLSWLFYPNTLFDGPSKYVVDGVVTWGYVLPFFLSNFLANIYGYFMNMKVTFKGKGSKKGLIIYLVVLFTLILFSTWLQGVITAALMKTSLAWFARTLAVWASGFVQFCVMYPLEKFVLFKEKAENV